MKIAYIGQKGIPVINGGVERHVEELALRMASLGHEVFVYTRPYYTPNDLVKYKGVNLISLPSIYTKHLDAISHTLLASLHACFQDYDIIHYQGVGPALLSFIPRLFKPKAKILVTFHCLDRKHEKWGGLAKQILKFGEWAACNFPHQTIAVSQNIQDYCQKTYHKKVVFLPNGVTDCSDQQLNQRVLNLYNLEPKKYFLMVNRLIPHKNVEETIKAFVNLPRKDYKLVIVGDGFFTDEYVTQLKNLAVNYPDIVFTGNQQGDDLKALYRNALAYISSSKNEGLSFTLLEALSFKLPVILKNIPENQEFFKAGVALTYEKPLELENSISELINNQALSLALGQSGYSYARQNFDWSEIIKKTNDLYLKTLDQSNLENTGQEVEKFQHI